MLNDLQDSSVEWASQQKDLKEAAAFLKNLQISVKIAGLDWLAPGTPQTPGGH